MTGQPEDPFGEKAVRTPTKQSILVHISLSPEFPSVLIFVYFVGVSRKKRLFFGKSQAQPSFDEKWPEKNGLPAKFLSDFWIFPEKMAPRDLRIRLKNQSIFHFSRPFFH